MRNALSGHGKRGIAKGNSQDMFLVRPGNTVSVKLCGKSLKIQPSPYRNNENVFQSVAQYLFIRFFN